LTKKYSFLSKSQWEINEYSIVPIREEDRYLIMQWRNEQLFHLRQTLPLTVDLQDNYFANVISKLFEEPKPNQILFSYLKNNICYGYGGLVHINWQDKNAEISFVMNTALEKFEFEIHWQNFLKLIKQIAFEELDFHKIYTYAYDLRPRLYTALAKEGFKKEAVLVDHIYFDNKYVDVLIHSIINTN